MSRVRVVILALALVFSLASAASFANGGLP